MRRWLAGLALALMASVGHAQTPVCTATSDSVSGGSETTCTITLHVACTPCPTVTPTPEPTPAPSSLLTGLVSVWPLEADGTDSVGSNDLTNNNGVTFVAKGVGAPANLPDTVANFVSGSNQYFTAAASLVNGATKLSVSVWTNHTANSLDELIWDGTTYGIQIETDRDVTFYASGTAYEQTTDTGVLPENTWTHVVYVYDGTQGTTNDRIKIYVNGSLVTNVSNPSPPPTSLTSVGPFTIGRYPGGGFQWDGQVSLPMIWSRDLTADEAACLYAAGAAVQYPFTGVCN